MECGTKLTIEEKFKEMRISKGVSQVDFAKAIGRGEHTVIKVEKGERPLTDEEIEAGRKFFRAENYPLLEGEVAGFKGKLYVLKELAKEEALEEARRLRNSIAVINDFHFEPEMALLYKAINARLLLKEQDMDVARESLEAVKFFLGNGSFELRYHYYYAMGSLNMYTRNHKEAIRYYKLACDIEAYSSQEPSVFFNLAVCYSRFGMYFSTLISLERIYNNFRHDMTSTTGIMVVVNLALNYTRIGHYEKALMLHKEALLRIEPLGNALRLACILHNLGCLYYKTGKYKDAIKEFNKALQHFTERSHEYLETLYFKILSLIADKSSEYNLELDHAKVLAENNEYYSLLFNSLSHVIKLREKEDAQYIEDKIVAYLRDRHDYFKVMIYYEILKKFYAKNKTKTFEIKASICDIQARMMRENI